MTYGGGPSNPFIDPVDDLRTPLGGYGSFYLGQDDNGIRQTTSVVGQPIQPLSRDTFMTQPGLRLQGALVTELRKQDVAGFDPAISVVGMDGSTTVLPPEPQYSNGTWPTDFAVIHHVQGDDTIKAYGGRFTFTGVDVGKQRVYERLRFRAFYTDPTEAFDDVAPTVNAFGTKTGIGPSTEARFSITTSSDATAAYVMYLPGGSDTFELLRLEDMTSGSGFKTWTTDPIAVGNAGVTEFFGEAVDQYGNVGYDTFKGVSTSLTDAALLQGTTTTSVVTEDYPSGIEPPSSMNGWYTEQVNLLVRSTAGPVQAAVLPDAAQSWPSDPTYNYYSAIVDVPNSDGVYQVDHSAGATAGSTFVKVDVDPPTIDEPVITGSSSPADTAPTTDTYIAPSTTVTVEISDAGSGVGVCTIDITFPDGSTAQDPCSAGVNPLPFEEGDGRYEFTITAKDNAGHQSTETLGFRLDPTAPEISSSFDPGPTYTPVSGPTYVTSATGIKFDRPDPQIGPLAPAGHRFAGSGFASCTMTLRYRSGADVAQDCTGQTQTYDLSPKSTHADGDYTFKTTATDKVDNTSAESSLTVRLDNTAPTFGTCPAPSASVANATSARVAVSQTSKTQTTLTVDEYAAPPHANFIDLRGHRADARDEAGPGRWLPSSVHLHGDQGIRAALSPTDPRGIWTAGTAVVWNIPGRHDLLGIVGTSLGGTPGATSMTVQEERFGAPELPFLVMVDDEQMLVTGRSPATLVQPKSYTVVRGFGGTAVATHGPNAQVLWAGPVYGLLNTSVSSAATSHTLQVNEGRFPPSAVPFEITVGRERMTVVSRTNPEVSPPTRSRERSTGRWPRPTASARRCSPLP